MHKCNGGNGLGGGAVPDRLARALYVHLRLTPNIFGPGPKMAIGTESAREVEPTNRISTIAIKIRKRSRHRLDWAKAQLPLGFDQEAAFWLSLSG